MFTAYDDAMVCYYLPLCIHSDTQLQRALWCIRNFLRIHTNPLTQLVVQVDGPIVNIGALMEIRELCYDSRIEYREVHGLYNLDKAGFGVAVELMAWQLSRRRWLVKFDTDTKFYRRLSSMPTGRGMYGSVLSDSTINFIQGGCRILSPGSLTTYELHTFISRMLNYALSLTPEDATTTWGANKGAYSICAEHTYRVCEELVMAWVGKQVSLDCLPHHEVCCHAVNLDPPKVPYTQKLDLRYNYAVSHPHKDDWKTEQV